MYKYTRLCIAIGIDVEVISATGYITANVFTIILEIKLQHP